MTTCFKSLKRVAWAYSRLEIAEQKATFTHYEVFSGNVLICAYKAHMVVFFQGVRVVPSCVSLMEKEQ